jgi:hypothetical protein
VPDGDGDPDGDPDGEGEGDGEGDFVGFGEADSVAEGVGETVCAGEGTGDGTDTVGPSVYPSKLGTGNDSGVMPSIATDMKSCQIAAGIVPPYTEGTPSTFSSGISPWGQPIHTQVTSCTV